MTMEYKQTLNLPQTNFPMKADLPKRELAMLAQWERDGLYQRIRDARKGRERFVLHDGPPYANGDIHIGHALNKILKDLIVRYQTMRGYDAPYVPGWDCHGMPIEHALFKELGMTKHQIEQLAFRKQAQAYAERFVGTQREQFKRLGVMGEWQVPYLTMTPDYEAAQLRAFARLVEQGYIERQLKPVYWCATCETALAEAEVEYEDRQDTSIYVKFEIMQETLNKLPLTSSSAAKRRYFFVIWTTTPWTLPANVAVALHPEKRYAMVDRGEEVWIMAADPAPQVLNAVGVQIHPNLRATKPGNAFVGYQYARPFSSTPGVVVTSDFVSMEEGTGIVHIAPGHGEADYTIGQQHGLEIVSPVDERGVFTKDGGAWAGVSVQAANPKIIADLKQRGLLLEEEPITHSYPQCWRCKQPIIFRATHQWFLRVDHQDLRQRLHRAINEQVHWTPSQGRERINGMITERPDWCLSRQRYWGVPMPVVYCDHCKQPLLDPSFIMRVADEVARAGSDWWVETPVERMPALANRRCACGQTQWVKGQDIFDVWFDSGVSHEAVLRPRGWHPAQLYLEGSDQHRGWFQVSLITGVALQDRAPYESVLTHGFVMDGEGRKMSKSAGNVVSPQEVMRTYGADILRLWVATCDYSEDVRISPEILERTADTYRKLRNTLRFLLGNLNDFDPRRDRVTDADLLEIDRWVLARLEQLIKDVTAAYEAYQFHVALRAIYAFCVVDLSSFYLDVLKDRLYTFAATGCQRRSAQTALCGILFALARLLAPVLSLTAEETWLDVAERWGLEPSVHVASWPAPTPSRHDSALVARWDQLLSVRESVLKALEDSRMAKVIGNALEARVTIAVHDEALRQLLQHYATELPSLWIVSDVEVASRTAATPVEVSVSRAAGRKCQRCWRWVSSVGRDAGHPALCDRCVHVLKAVSVS